MDAILFTIRPEGDLEAVWDQLASQGFDLLYSSEVPGGAKEIYAGIPPSPEINWEEGLPYPVASAAVVSLPEIDWERQWEAHSPAFEKGRLSVDLALHGFVPSLPLLLLQPGAGFGDLSHPTTALVLGLMGSSAPCDLAVDVGCGSGILALSAALAGCSKVYGLDIDEGALAHAEENGRLNGVQERVTFQKPSSDLIFDPISPPLLILMNMIFKEQQQAWGGLLSLHGLPGVILTSGILVEERPFYLGWAKEQGWCLQEEREKGGWLAFRFHNRF